MFPADTHVHSLISKDCDFSRREMAAAAARRGLWGICFTDHYDVIDMDSSYNPHFDWEPVRRAQAEARRQVGEKFPLLYGLELGNAPRDFEAAERAVSEPGLDFALCSVHNLCAELGGTDFYFVDYNTPQLCHAHLEDYFRTMEQSLTWGNFDVLAHIPYPLRYMRDRDGQAVDLEPYWPQIEKILKKTIDMGKGIECNCKNWTPAMMEDYRHLLLP